MGGGGRARQFFEREGCRMVEMACEEHDRIAAGSQFITHTIGRVLGAMAPQPSAIDTRGYEARCPASRCSAPARVCARACGKFCCMQPAGLQTTSREDSVMVVAGVQPPQPPQTPASHHLLGVLQRACMCKRSTQQPTAGSRQQK